MQTPLPVEPQAALESVAERRRWVTAEPLNVSPALLGLPLATPGRRALSMGIDLAVLALVAESGDLWLFGGLLLVLLQLRNARQGLEDRKRLGWVLAALVLWLALSQALDLLPDRVPPAPAVAGKTMVEAEPAAETEALTIVSADAPSSAAAQPPDDAQAARIAGLERQLAAARAARPKTLREQAEEAFELVGARLGWGIVYFSLLPAWWGGQTLGKRLLGLRVVQLTGQPVTVMTSLKRYGGYAAGMATGGLGFAQIFWDPNRQGLQDKSAHTVVVDLRAPRRALQANDTSTPEAEAPGQP